MDRSMASRLTPPRLSSCIMHVRLTINAHTLTACKRRAILLSADTRTQTAPTTHRRTISRRRVGGKPGHEHRYGVLCLATEKLIRHNGIWYWTKRYPKRNDGTITDHGTKLLGEAWSKIQNRFGASVTGVIYCECALIGYLKTFPSLPQWRAAPLNGWRNKFPA